MTTIWTFPQTQTTYTLLTTTKVGMIAPRPASLRAGMAGGLVEAGHTGVRDMAFAKFGESRW